LGSLTCRTPLPPTPLAPSPRSCCAPTSWVPRRPTPTTPAGTARPRARNRPSNRGAGEPVEMMWVKGSGGNLGTLTESGLAILALDRLRALRPCSGSVETRQHQGVKIGPALTASRKKHSSHGRTSRGSSSPTRPSKAKRNGCWPLRPPMAGQAVGCRRVCDFLG